MCAEEGIKLKVFYNKRPTLVKQRIIAHGHQINRLDFGEEILKEIEPTVKNKIKIDLEKELNNNEYDFIIFSDYNKKLFSKELSKEIISLANNKKILTHVDPKPQNIDFFKNCTIISPNKREAEIMTGIKYNNGEDVLIKMAKKLSEIVNPKYVIITCGEDGVFSYDTEKEKYSFIDTKAREVADVTGAGDTFAASFPLALSSGADLFNAVKLANYASGVVVEKVGTAIPTIKEIIKRIKQDNNI